MGRLISRRVFLQCGLGVSAVAALATAKSAASPVVAGTAVRLQVAYAGSMAAVMEGKLRQAARQQGWDVQGRAQGATALAELIVGGALRPDVFISITPGPMQVVRAADKADAAAAFAATAMTLAYDPHGRWAQRLQQGPWWQVLQEPGFRLGRSDPRTDPQGRNIIYVCLLAEANNRKPGLAHKLLGTWINPKQIFSESTLEARVQSGQLDAAAAYRFQPAAYGLAALALPQAVNLASLPTAAAELQLDFGGHVYRPEPLVFYAAALRQAAHPAAARAFVRWLNSKQAQTVLQQAGYGQHNDPIQ
ncbi:MAG: substrate-binding domain-containing protein [Terriglobales bacterium]